MSFTDRLVLWLHIGFAIFTVGTLTVAIMSTPRYIRARNQTVVGYLYRTTRIYTLLSLGVLIFGLVLTQIDKDFSKPWLSVSLTLFVVALVLLTATTLLGLLVAGRAKSKKLPSFARADAHRYISTVTVDFCYNGNYKFAFRKASTSRSCVHGVVRTIKGRNISS